MFQTQKIPKIDKLSPEGYILIYGEFVPGKKNFAKYFDFGDKTNISVNNEEDENENKVNMYVYYMSFTKSEEFI